MYHKISLCVKIEGQKLAKQREFSFSGYNKKSSKLYVYWIFYGAANQIRTGDLVLTKDVLCLLTVSYTHLDVYKRQRQKGMESFHVLLFVMICRPYPSETGKRPFML